MCVFSALAAIYSYDRQAKLVKLTVGGFQSTRLPFVHKQFQFRDGAEMEAPKIENLKAEDPVTILIIGPSQNGKSTFINRIVSLAKNSVQTAAEGDGNFKCTADCKIYDLEVPFTDYKLVHAQDDTDYEVPSLDDEETFLTGAWWRKQTRSKYKVVPKQPDGLCFRLRLIDTPGLDDSEGKDYENMGDVLGMLNKMSQKPVRWEREINAVVLVYNANSAFSFSFQKTLRNYQRCMPNLFGGLAVINTNFSVTTWAQKRQHFIRENLLQGSETAKTRLMRERRTEFTRILDRSATHFFIDSKPRNNFMFDELLSRNTVSDILNFWAASPPMEIGHMRLIKTDDMQIIDSHLQELLREAVSKWEVEKHNILKTLNPADEHSSNVRQSHDERANHKAQIEKDLRAYENDEKFTLQRYNTADTAAEVSSVGLLINQVFGKRIQASFSIRAEIFNDKFQVDINTPDPRNVGTWITDEWIYAEDKTNPKYRRTWTGKYEAEPGKRPQLHAISYVPNFVYHKEKIQKSKKEIDKIEMEMAKEAPTTGANLNPKVEELMQWITSAKDLMEVLGQETPPLDTGFDKAARRRYRKEPSKADVDDLLDVVRVAKPALEGPVRACLKE
jgi:GTPase SAR1 family protein